jgi:hypothetical protein
MYQHNRRASVECQIPQIKIYGPMRMKRILCLLLLCFLGCSKEKTGAEKADELFPGGRPMITQIQKQIDWKKKHAITPEQASDMCHKWLEKNPGKSVEQFWKHAVTVEPKELM